MTEDEAKGKACCAAVRDEEQAGKLTLKAPTCIASACMAWRWSVAAIPARIEEAETGTATPRVKIAPPAGEGWVGRAAGRDKRDRLGEHPYRWITWEREIAAVPGEGFCGLAGAPQ